MNKILFGNPIELYYCKNYTDTDRLPHSVTIVLTELNFNWKSILGYSLKKKVTKRKVGLHMTFIVYVIDKQELIKLDYTIMRILHEAATSLKFII